jgi:hypothetical protein
MNEQNKFKNQAGGLKEPAGMQDREMDQEMNQDFELEQALHEFKSSVHAWSDAAYNRPRTVTREIRHRSWRLASGWALGCLLVAGSVSGGLFEHQHRIDLEKASAQRAAEQQKLARQQQAAGVSDEVLLAGVDNDVSRQVPSAMEPLAQMMSEDESK